MLQEIMSAERLTASLSLPDLSCSKNGVHAINVLMEKIKNSLGAMQTPVSLEVYRSDPIVTVKENFDDLLFPADNVGRSSRYTRYVSPTKVLRTHTSAAIPGWLKQAAQKGIEDNMVLVPGMCYRREIVDRIHCGEPHQMEIWRVKKSYPRLDRKDLIHLIDTVLNSVLPGYQYRANEVQHPYTINGLEVEILVGKEWLEILECGEAHPIVLKNAGLDPKEYSGLALGMGLDRLVMVIKGIDDIRVLRSSDPRIKSQMTNLDPYVAVSNQPVAKRVISYSSSKDKAEEDVCELIRDTLGTNAKFLERVEIEEIPYENLPEKARVNLGIHPTQKNIVATLTFRSMESSLPRNDINGWVKDLYQKLNEGEKGYM